MNTFQRLIILIRKFKPQNCSTTYIFKENLYATSAKTHVYNFFNQNKKKKVEYQVQTRCTTICLVKIENNILNKYL